jgi:hypothetical protein
MNDRVWLHHPQGLAIGPVDSHQVQALDSAQPSLGDGLASPRKLASHPHTCRQIRVTPLNQEARPHSMRRLLVCQAKRQSQKEIFPGASAKRPPADVTCQRLCSRLNPNFSFRERGSVFPSPFLFHSFRFSCIFHLVSRLLSRFVLFEANASIHQRLWALQAANKRSASIPGECSFGGVVQEKADDMAGR